MRDEVCGIYLIERYIKSNFVLPILIGDIDEDEIPFCLRGKDRVDFRSVAPEIGFGQVTKLASQLAATSIVLSESGMGNFTRLANAVEIIELICSHFHIVTRQLRQRYNDRPTLVINDEYDVQDLFHTLLRLFFSDVRPEEWTPSYAGGSSRVDFLLKSEQVVIEVKKRKGDSESKRAR